MKSFGNNDIPVSQLCSPYEITYGEDVEMNQEQEEEELHRRLNNCESD